MDRIATEQDHRKCDQIYLVWNSHGQVTTLPMAIPDAEILVVWFFAVCCV